MSNEPRKKIGLLLPKLVISFPTLFEPRPVGDDGTLKYSAQLIFPEGTDLQEAEEAALEVAVANFGKDAVSLIKKNKLKWPFRGVNQPGVDDLEDIEKKGLNRYGDGVVFANASSKRKPGVVSVFPDPDTGEPATIVNDAGDVRFSNGTVLPGARPIWGGNDALAYVMIYSFDFQGNRGVTLGLNHVQILGDGEHRLDGSVAPSAVFQADPDAVPDLSDLTEAQDSEEDGSDGMPNLSQLMG